MEAIGILAGGIAHDFNNLLNVINGYCELVLDDLAEDNPIRNDIRQINQAGTRAKSLTSQLLAFSRKQILQPAIMDLNDAIANLNSMLRRLIPENIDLAITVQSCLGLIYADMGQVQQILMNLVINARDAMPQGGKLTIETANVYHDEEYVQSYPAVKVGSYVMLAISDNGIGMDKTIKSHLFEPFFTTKEKGKGTGLGLSTVYGIVKQSDGFIWVYSEPGKGTTFKVYFPRVEGKVAKLKNEIKSELRTRGVETLLLIEDESSVRSLAARILRERDYTVLEASNGQEALDVAREYAGVIHLTLTDVIMPGMSCKDLVSQLDAMRPGIKVLYTSGYTDNAIVHHGILDSGVTFLQKPFTVEHLERKVREVLDS
jgi:CheY-like chemotaxis protein